NGLGSTEALTDGSGTVTATYKYDVFGAVRNSTGAGSTGFKFTGQQEDGATGLVYLRARLYDPATGRFLSMDPFRGDPSDPASLNRYAYVRNNPIGLVDPDGLEPDSAWTGNVAHAIIQFWFSMGHPRAMTELDYF